LEQQLVPHISFRSMPHRTLRVAMVIPITRRSSAIEPCDRMLRRRRQTGANQGIPADGRPEYSANNPTHAANQPIPE